jgi:hypothetical protein
MEIETGWDFLDEVTNSDVQIVGSGVMVGRSTMDLPHVLFGSEDSTDYDIMVFVKKIPSIQKCKELCKSYDERFSYYYVGRDVNTNLAVIEDGVIVDVYKGFAKECNNMVVDTYNLHYQLHENPVTRLVEVDKDYIDTKVSRTIRIVLSTLSRSKYRPIIKRALRGNNAERMYALDAIQLFYIDDVGKHSSEDVFKTVAFQIGQCLGMLEGRGLFSKSAVIGQYPKLKPYLDREPDTSKLDLHSVKVDLLMMIQERYQEEIFDLEVK